jgi:hypothetical protein
VLDGWTRATTTPLPDAATLFGFLCCVEETDREPRILQATWAVLWRQLERPGEPPDLSTALAPLVQRALIAVQSDPDTGQPTRYRIHPGVAGAGRAVRGYAYSDRPPGPVLDARQVAGLWPQLMTALG